MQTNMKELLLTRKGDKIESEIKNFEIPKPKDDEVLIKVTVTGVNPKDWKYLSDSEPRNSGDDIAGTIATVGSKVVEFKEGDRVAAFHVMKDPHGSFAEYAIAPAHTTFHIPKNISDEEAATVPLCILTAGVGVHGQLGLPTPWHPATASTNTPLLVYGGSSANGLFALKLARLSGISPLIAIAGGGADIIKEGNYADHIIDYRNEKDLSGAILKALDGKELHHAYDAISEHGSTAAISKAMVNGGIIAGVIPVKEEDYDTQGGKVTWKQIYVGGVHHGYGGFWSKENVDRDREYGYVMSKYTTRVLENGRLKAHPFEVVKGGLNGIAEGLAGLKDGTIRAKKIVARIAETK